MILTMALMFLIAGLIVFVTLLAREATVITVPTCRCGRFVIEPKFSHADADGIVHTTHRCSPKEEEIA